MLNLGAPNFSTTVRYGFAILTVLFASLLREILGGILGAGVPFILFYPTVLLSAWFGGFWPGIFSSFLSGFVALYVFMPPYFALGVAGAAETAQLMIFLLSASFMSLLAESMRQATRTAQQNEIRQREMYEQYRVTLASIGDAVMVTDDRGRVAFMNPVAETLTGWRFDEASGRLLDEIFRVVNEQTRQKVENPALRALEQGIIVGLANHTVLIARDGSEHPIDDSAAPIRNASSEVVGVALVFRDISERQRAQKTQATLAAIVESSEDAIVSKDLNGRIITWNTGAERLFGYREAEVVGRPITLIIPPDQIHEEAAILERIRRGERIEHYETVRVRKDGSRVDISLTVSPVKAADGTIVGASKIARDITDRRRMEQQVLEADRQKDNFIAILAHELRNPLSPIRNAVKILEMERSDDADLCSYCDLIDKEVMQINRLLDDLLDMSRIAQGKLSLQRKHIDAAAAVKYAIETSRPAIDEAGHHLTVHLLAEPLVLEADLTRLAQVFSNLLNNAAKFTPPGGEIGIVVNREDNQAIIRVKDSGIGIRPELMPKIFDMFVQGEPITDRTHGGLGLGLTLVRDIVEFHGGSVEARSDGLGHGSEFIVRLPLSAIAAATEIAESDSAKATGRAGLSPLRIVVVDDNRNQAQTLQRLLQAMGHEVRVAYHGIGAMKLLTHFVPDIALLDLGLPKINGLDLARWLRSQDQFRSVTLIAQTGWGRDEDRQRAREAGFDDHLVKPIDHERLAEILARSSTQ